MKNRLAQKITSALVLVFASATAWQVSAKEISQEQLQQVMKNDKQVVLLDVRTVEEFEEAHIPNAVNIPHKELKARLAELSGAQNTQIILYCRSGKRAAIAKQILVESGFNQLDHLTGDFNGWSSNNLPLNKGSK